MVSSQMLVYFLVDSIIPLKCLLYNTLLHFWMLLKLESWVPPFHNHRQNRWYLYRKIIIYQICHQPLRRYWIVRFLHFIMIISMKLVNLFSNNSSSRTSSKSWILKCKNKITLNMDFLSVREIRPLKLFHRTFSQHLIHFFLIPPRPLYLKTNW